MDALPRLRLEIRDWLELDTWETYTTELGLGERESDLVKLGGDRVQIDRLPDWPRKHRRGKQR